MNFKYILSILLAATLFVACEDTIDVDLREADDILVVDAWLNNKMEAQVIKLMLSQPYFEQNQPPALSGATVIVTGDNGTTYNFAEGADGEYVWSPIDSTTFGTIGTEYTLNIILADGKAYQSKTMMKRTAQVDSISYTFEEETAFFPETYIGEVWARDPEGQGDSYWIKTYKNGQLLNKPSEINIAFDAAFSEGSNFDGIAFIQPIRQGMNPLDQDENDEFLPPYEIGDSAYVEIHSISNEAFYFLNEVAIQTDRPGGFGELFAQPLANVPTNIYPADGSDSEVIGFFNVAAVSALGKKLED